MAKEVIFMRKDSRNGIYTSFLDDKEIRLKDRELYPTQNSKLINLLKKDPEISVYTPADDSEDDDSEDGNPVDPADADSAEGDPGEGDPDKEDN